MRKEFLKQDERRKFIVNIGDQFISQYLKEKMSTLNRGKMIRLAFSHINYILEVMSIGTKSHFTHQFFSNNIQEHKGSLLDSYYMKILERRIKKKFSDDKEGGLQDKLDVLSVIDFDSNIQNCEEVLFEHMVKIGVFYEYLCSHTLILQELFNKSTQLIDENFILIKCFKQLFMINPNDKVLQFLASIYTQTLDFEERKFSRFTHRYDQIQLQKIQQKIKKYFSKESCVVYSTFMKNIITIKKVSKQFQNIFQFNQKDVIDKSINNIIPKYFQSDHEEILDNFCNNGQMSIIEQGQRMIFAQEGEGHIIPLMIELKIQSGINDFGVSAFFSLFDNTKDFIFLTNDLQILDMTKNIFDIIFSHTQLQTSNLRMNSILQIIPLLWVIEDAKEYNVEYQSILFLKKKFLKDYCGNDYLHSTKRKQLNQLLRNIDEKNDAQYFNITFKYCLFQINSIGKTYKYIEISKIKKERILETLDVSIQQITRSLNDLIDKKVIETKEMNHLNQFKIKQNLHQTNKININENLISQSDWDTPNNSIKSSQQQSQRKSFLYQYSQNKQLSAIVQHSVNQEQLNVDKFNHLLPISKRNSSVENAKKQLDYQNDNKKKQINNDILDFQINHQNNDSLSQRNLIPLQQESFSFSPKEDHPSLISLISPRQLDISLISPIQLQLNQKSNQYSTQYESDSKQKCQSSVLIKIEEENQANVEEQEDFLQKIGGKKNNQIQKINKEHDNLSKVFSNSIQDNQDLHVKRKLSFKRDNSSEASAENNKKQDNIYYENNKNIFNNQVKIQILDLQVKPQNYDSILECQPNLRDQSNNGMFNLISQRTMNQIENKQLIDQKNQDNISQSFRIEEELRKPLSQSEKKYSSQDKKSLIQKIKSKRITYVIKIMILISLVSFLMFLTITILMYLFSKQSLDQFRNVLSFIDKPVFIVVDILKMIKSATLNLVISLSYKDDFENDISINEGKQAIIDAYSSLDDFRYTYKELHQNQDFENKMINYLGDHMMQINFYTFGLYITDKQQYDEDDLTAIQTPYSMNLFSAIGEYFGHMYTFLESFELYLKTLLGGEFMEYTADMKPFFLWKNLILFTQEMGEFSIYVHKDTLNQFEILQNFQTYLVLIVGTVCCISILSVLPLYSYKQKQREKILKLIGSFQPNILMKQIEHIEQTLAIIESKHDKLKYKSLIEDNSDKQTENIKKQQDNSKKQFVKSISLYNKLPNSQSQIPFSSAGLKTKSTEYEKRYYIEKNINKRNRSIASFRGLPKINIIISLISLFVIATLMIQPITTLVLTKKFVEEQKILMNEKSTMLFSLSQILQNQTPNYSIFQQLAGGKIAKKLVYFEYLSSIRDNNSKQIQQLSSLVDYFSVHRRDSQNFEDFYKQILNGNICEVKESFKQYFQSNITQSECELIGGGILKRGLILSTKYAYELWDNFYKLYDYYDSEDEYSEHYYTYLYYIVRDRIIDNQLIDINRLNNILISSAEALLLYQNESQENYSTYIEDTYYYLFIVQLIIIILLFLLGWINLLMTFNKQLIQTKLILTLFHIQLLAENQIIVKFFKENDFGVK